MKKLALMVILAVFWGFIVGCAGKEIIPDPGDYESKEAKAVAKLELSGELEESFLAWRGVGEKEFSEFCARKMGKLPISERADCAKALGLDELSADLEARIKKAKAEKAEAEKRAKAEKAEKKKVIKANWSFLQKKIQKAEEAKDWEKSITIYATILADYPFFEEAKKAKGNFCRKHVSEMEKDAPLVASRCYRAIGMKSYAKDLDTKTLNLKGIKLYFYEPEENYPKKPFVDIKNHLRNDYEASLVRKRSSEDYFLFFQADNKQWYICIYKTNIRQGKNVYVGVIPIYSRYINYWSIQKRDFLTRSIAKIICHDRQAQAQASK